jgi:protein-disulfide isomerase
MKIRHFIAAAAISSLTLSAAVAFAQRDLGERRGGEQRSDGPDRRNWTDTVQRTPEGGVRMGNPNAPVKLIEYLSLTCPHCAEFTAQGGERLFQYYVRTGRVSIEYRNYTLNGYDLAAAFLSRCASPREYFNMTHYLLGHQPQWMGRMQALTDAQRAELRAMTPIQAMQRLAQLLAIDAIASRHGITPAQQRACLADQAALDRIAQVMQAAQREHNVSGTPTFVINGVKQDVAHWAQLEPLLRDAAGN